MVPQRSNYLVQGNAKSGNRPRHCCTFTKFIANIGAALQTLVGGNITAWSSLCEQARSEAFEIMIQHATEVNANAVICARYDATEISSGVTEVSRMEPRNS